jgi:fructokinase
MPTATPIARSTSRTSVRHPILVGSGFLALDLLFRNSSALPTKRYAGGSFGNVMTILSFLGWRSYPVARLGTDSYANDLLNDLKEFQVETRFVRRAGKGATPLIIVRVAKNADGTYRSRFEWRHPRSGSRLPSHRPFPRFMAEEISPQLPNAKVFYFDRAEPGSLLLATKMRGRGALVFFEPSSCRDDRMFTACMAISDIVKYSAQRIVQPPHNPDDPSPRLEIQTLGACGLRYRLKQNSNRPGAWRHLDGFPVENLKDSTGCGDWCSAGFIHKMGQFGRKGFLRIDESKIASALMFGQALSAVNCQYEGARGPMYTLSRQALVSAAQAFLTEGQEA